MSKRLTTEEFIKRAIKIHNNKYEYSKVNYVNIYTKVIIICPKHGEFKQNPGNHLSGSICRKCSYLKIGFSKRSNLKDIINKANQVHNNKYDYSLLKYLGMMKRGIIICPKHGEFKQIINDHINSKAGCPECSNCKKLNTKEFIKRAIKTHGNKYDYSKVNYINSQKKVIIICKKHGRFLQCYADHVFRKAGCPKCWGTISKEEIQFLEFLKNNNKSYLEIISQTDKKYQKYVKIIREKIKRKLRPDIILIKDDEIIILEYSGDYWHGKEKCDFNLKINISMAELKKISVEKSDLYKKYFDYIEIFGEEWKNFLKIREMSNNIKILFKKLSIEENDGTIIIV